MKLNKTRVLIVDDHPIVRQGLQTFLGLCAEVEVVGEACNGMEALSKAEELLPDVILMDLVMPGLNGTDVIKQLKLKGNRAKVVVLSSFVERDMVKQAIRNGATSYLMKDVHPSELVRVILAARDGVPQLHPVVMQKLIQEVTIQTEETESPREELTRREKEVLSLLAEGLSNKEIGERMCVSIKTAKSHVSNVIQKLGVASRIQAALWALKDNMPESK